MKPFIREYISKVLKKFHTKGPGTPQEISQALFARILCYQSHQTHGGLNVDRKTWRRLKTLRQQTKRMRGLNAYNRTSGGKG